MRAVIKGPGPKKLKNVRCQTNLSDLIVNRHKKLVPKSVHSAHFYRGSITDRTSVKYLLLHLYKQKCAFCETKYSNLDVDHYRPKDAIFENEKHPGYYWLGYEWTNLLPVCGFCNQDNKKTQFPISKRYVLPKSTWLDSDFKKDTRVLMEKLKIYEKPLLLNPEEKRFDPIQYIKFDRDGKPNGIDSGKRGAETIRICGLDNTTLNSKRKQPFDDLIISSMEIYLRLHHSLSDEELIKELEIILSKLQEDEEREHTLFWKWAAKDPEHFIFNHPRLQLKKGHRLIRLIKEVLTLR